MAANIFLGTTNSNYNVNTNWSLGTIPTATDGNIVTFNGSSPNCTINAVSLGNNIDFTNYTNTITFSNTLTISGNVTLGINMNFAGTFSLIINANSSMTSNGKTFGVPLIFLSMTAGNTYTLVDNWTVNALVTNAFNTVALTNTINNNNLFCLKGFTFNSGTSNSNSVNAGTTNINFIGTGTISVINGTIKNNLIFNAGTNTITITSASSFLYNTGIITYTSGVIVSTTTITINGNTTFDFSSTNIFAIPLKFNFAGTISPIITLLSDAYIFGNITISTNTVFNGYNMYISCPTFTFSTICSGTTNFIIAGTNSTSSTTFTGGGTIKNNFTINTPGTFILVGAINYNTGIFTYISGNVISTGSTLFIAANTTFNTNSMSFNNITLATIGFTITLNSVLNINGNLTIPGLAYTFAGAYGFICSGLIFNALGTIGYGLTLANGINYVIKNSFTAIIPTANTPVTIKSDNPGTQAILTILLGCNQLLNFIKATDIDSSQGAPVLCWSPTLSNTNNWKSLTYLNMQSAKTFIN